MQNIPTYKKTITWPWINQPVFSNQQKCENCPITSTYPLRLLHLYKFYFIWTVCKIRDEPEWRCSSGVTLVQIFKKYFCTTCKTLHVSFSFASKITRAKAPHTKGGSLVKLAAVEIFERLFVVAWANKWDVATL